MTNNSRELFGFIGNERREYESTVLRLTAASHIENYLDNAGLQAKDLATRVGKSRSWISKLLSGRQNVTLDTLAETAWALGARWRIDLVAAERLGTPAENDPPPPPWAHVHRAASYHFSSWQSLSPDATMNTSVEFTIGISGNSTFTATPLIPPVISHVQQHSWSTAGSYSSAEVAEAGSEEAPAVNIYGNVEES